MATMSEEIARVDLFLNDVKSLPTLPEILSRLNRMLSDPETKIGDVVDLILRDQALTANLLKIVNSSFFARHRQIMNVREAVVFLGFRTLRNLIMTTTLMRSLRWEHSCLNPRPFWEHSLATALVAKDIAERVGFDDPEMAYLGGLAHDLGLVLMSQHLPDQMEQVVQIIEEESCSLYEAERRVFGVGHTAFGAWLGVRWNFPKELVEAMFYHEEPSEDAEHLILVALVSLSDIFCRSTGLGYGIREYWSRVIENHFSLRTLRRYYPAVFETDWERFQMDLRDRARDIRELVTTLFRPQTKDVVAS